MSTGLEALFSTASAVDASWETSASQPETAANQVEAEFDAVFSEISIEVEDYFPPLLSVGKLLPLKFKAILLSAKEFSFRETSQPNKELLNYEDSHETVEKSAFIKVSAHVREVATHSLTPKVKETLLSRSELLFFPKSQSSLKMNGENFLSSSAPSQAKNPHSITQAKNFSPLRLQIPKNTSLSHAAKPTPNKANERPSSFSHAKEVTSRMSFSQSTSLKEAQIQNFSVRKEQEKERDQQQQQQQQQHQRDSQEQEKDSSKKSDKIEGLLGISLDFWGTLRAQYEKSRSATAPVEKPRLPSPQIGVFALYYILDKMGLSSECISYKVFKGEIETLDVENSEAHKKMLEEMKLAIEKEKETTRWGTAAKVFSWIGSFTAIISGAVLIATGVGAVAGALLVAGGVISLANQIMEITGGWKKVAEILPGEDAEKKSAVVTWIQIGIGVLCLILSGAGIVFGGGFSAFGEASSIASNAIGAVATMGVGTTLIGKGISDFFYKNKIADTRKYEIRLAELKHRREDLIEALEDSPDRLLGYYESMARQLGFLEEMNRSYQRAW